MPAADHIILNDAHIVCPACDALWDKPKLKQGQRVRCGRCHDVIYEKKRDSWGRVVPATVAALILYLAAISFPFLGMERSGISNNISVIDTPGALWASGMHLLSIAIFIFIIVFPASRIVLLLGLMFLRLRPVRSALAVRVLRLYQALAPWAMAEIFLIGVVVSLVKLGSMVTISVGPSFWAMIGFVCALTLVTTQWCRDSVWEELGAPALSDER